MVESEKMVQMNLQNRDRRTDFENKPMDALFLNAHPGTVSGSCSPEIEWKILGSSLEFGWKNIQMASVSEPQFTASESGMWVSESYSVVSDSLQPHELYSPWISLGHNTGVGSLSFLQGIFPTQGSNPGFPHCRWILYQLSHKGSPGSEVATAIKFREVKKKGVGENSYRLSSTGGLGFCLRHFIHFILTMMKKKRCKIRIVQLLWEKSM